MTMRGWIVLALVAAVAGAAWVAFAGMQGPGWGPSSEWMGSGCGLGRWNTLPSSGARLAEGEILASADRYIHSFGDVDLEIEEIMVFDNHYYVEVKEESTGRYAFEFLIDPFTGRATPEPGPNMMWNEKYGHMRTGMMGRFFAPAPSDEEMAISPNEAVAIAQAYLDQRVPGLHVDDHAAPFYGYYTLHTLRDGETVGMLSVHGTTGDVWIHTWHGVFLGHLGEDEHGSV